MVFNRYRERIKAIFNRENIMRFLDKQGFYIVLFICISVIGVTALLTYGGETESQDGVGGNIPPSEEIADEDLVSDGSSIEDERNVEDIDIKVKDVLTDDSEEKSDSSNTEPAETSKPEQQLPASSEALKGSEGESNSNKDGDEGNREDIKPVVSQGESSKIVMIYPVEGEILKQYSMDELVYSNTLKECGTHSGIDIESFLGAEVKAAMDGVVEQIEEDPLMGIAITLDHGNGIKTRYANLSTTNMVAEGQEVKAGQVISGVGRTAGAEILDAPHLHFELIINEKYVNPMEYLK